MATADIDNDGLGEVLTGAGWGAANVTSVDAFRISGSSGTSISGLAFDAYPSMAYGTKVGVMQVP